MDVKCRGMPAKIGAFIEGIGYDIINTLFAVKIFDDFNRNV